MRLPRRTFHDAFHHAMNRAYEGKELFRDNMDRIHFLDLLKKIQEVSRLRILAYCLMDNHYHLILQNNNGRMSDFFKLLNGQYASYFRQRYGGRGYVFQDRFKSMLIQDEAYLMVSIGYILNNPVRARMVKEYSDYPWSSGKGYFSDNTQKIVNYEFVEDLFGNSNEFISFVKGMILNDLPTIRTDLGMIVGGKDLLFSHLERKADRRQQGSDQNIEMRRQEDGFHDSLTKVVQEFERKHGNRLSDLDLSTHAHKKLRAELLVLLRDKSGLTYREIARLDLFADLSINSLGTLYRRGKKGSKK